jgi:hypothetical protein
LTLVATILGSSIAIIDSSVVAPAIGSVIPGMFRAPTSSFRPRRRDHVALRTDRCSGSSTS